MFFERKAFFVEFGPMAPRQDYGPPNYAVVRDNDGQEYRIRLTDAEFASLNLVNGSTRLRIRVEVMS